MFSTLDNNDNNDNNIQGTISSSMDERGVTALVPWGKT